MQIADALYTVYQCILLCPSFQDTVVYSLLTFLFLFGSSLVASAIDYYQKLDGHVGQWTIEQLIVAVVSTKDHS